MKMLLHFVILKCPLCVLTPCTFLPMTTSEKPHGIWRHYFYNTTTRSFSTFILETLPLIDPVWIFCILLNILPNIVWGNICKKLEILFHTQFYVKWVFVNWYYRKLSFLRLWNSQNWFHVKYKWQKILKFPLWGFSSNFISQSIGLKTKSIFWKKPWASCKFVWKPTDNGYVNCKPWQIEFYMGFFEVFFTNINRILTKMIHLTFHIKWNFYQLIAEMW